MVQIYYNPFAAARLEYPDTQKEYYQAYVRRSNSSRVDESPFPRMVDLWWAGLSLAVRNGASPVDLNPIATTHMIEGAIFDRDPWRIQFLRLIALHIKEDPDILTRPTEIIAMANGLAAAGVPGIVEMLTDGDEPPIWNLSNAVERLLTNSTSEMEGS